jgi:hypothetical protein
MARSFIRIAVPAGREDDFNSIVARMLTADDAVELTREGASTTVDVLTERTAEVLGLAGEAAFDAEAVPAPDPPTATAMLDPALDPIASTLADVGVPLLAVTATGLLFSPVPPPVETLPCPSRTVFATGKGQGRSDAYTLFSTARVEDLEKEALNAARFDAMEQFKNALVVERVLCADGCRLLSTVVFGPAATEIRPTTEGLLGVGLTFRGFAFVPWEGAHVCGQNAIDPQQNSDDRTRPLACGDLFVRSGRITVDKPFTSESPVAPNTIGISPIVYDELATAAFAKAQDAIAKLPQCPGVSCPTPSLTVSLSQPTVTVLFQGGKQYVIRFTIDWRVELVCS